MLWHDDGAIHDRLSKFLNLSTRACTTCSPVFRIIQVDTVINKAQIGLSQRFTFTSDFIILEPADRLLSCNLGRSLRGRCGVEKLAQQTRHVMRPTNEVTITWQHCPNYWKLGKKDCFVIITLLQQRSQQSCIYAVFMFICNSICMNRTISCSMVTNDGVMKIKQ